MAAHQAGRYTDDAFNAIVAWGEAAAVLDDAQLQLAAAHDEYDQAEQAVIRHFMQRLPSD